MNVFLEILAVALLFIGSTFVFLGAVGVVRMPDVYTRLQTTSKSITLGAACILLSAAVVFADEGVLLRTLLIIGFLFMTTPIAAHVLSRVAYITHMPLAPETHVDELAGRYQPDGRLDSAPPPPPRPPAPPTS